MYFSTNNNMEHDDDQLVFIRMTIFSCRVLNMGLKYLFLLSRSVESASVLLNLLLLCGDVELNPGPSIYFVGKTLDDYRIEGNFYLVQIFI